MAPLKTQGACDGDDRAHIVVTALGHEHRPGELLRLRVLAKCCGKRLAAHFGMKVCHRSSQGTAGAGAGIPPGKGGQAAAHIHPQQNVKRLARRYGVLV